MPTSPVAVRGRNPEYPPLGKLGRPGSATKFGRMGLEKLGWFKILKNSARSCRLTCSAIAVFLYTEKLNSLKGGPFRELRPRLPKWRVPGIQLLSSPAPLPVGLPKVHGAAKALRSR